MPSGVRHWGMEQRRLGRTDHHSSVAILGGAAFARGTPEIVEDRFHRAIERGVNHLDIAPGYGLAEELMGPHIPAVRDRLFIGEKTGRKHPDGVRAQLETTLERLRTDHVDTYQAHGVTDVDDLDARAGAYEVILAARDEGLTRFVGITGHDLGTPRAQLEAIRRYDLDTVMFPLYARVWADPVYRSDVEALLAECAARDVGVQVIKAAAWRPWGDRELTAESWYEPFPDPERITRGVRFALSTPGVHGFATPGDPDVLLTALDAAEGFTPMTDDEREATVTAMADEPVIFPLREHARRAD
ncbi:MAG: aldo/keto reductase [Actinomycetota bacterium]